MSDVAYLLAVDTFQQDKAWFGQRIEENSDSLYSMALRLTANSADAEDLVSEAVIKAWGSLSALRDRSRFRPWLFRILYHAFCSEYRKVRNRPEVAVYDENADESQRQDIASLLVDQPDEFLSWWANPEREFFNSLMGEDIWRAIESLPEIFRETVLLINVEGLSYDEAAEVLDVSPGTIRSRMNRGRTLLQKALWEYSTKETTYQNRGQNHD